MFKTRIIEGELYISHSEIARWVYNQSTQLIGKPNGQPAVVLEQLTSEIKQSLATMDVIPANNPSVLRRDLDVFADRHAFYSLAQFYDWDEGISQPVLMALGEFSAKPIMKIKGEAA